MAERKVVNKYYPPDFDPKKHKSINKYVGQHPLRDRARKLGQGILIIRFEMPFHIWCGGCGRHIAKGVRFNAEKKQIGMYYTTKILSFRMKCPSCSQWIDIHTDPQNTDYKVVSGAKKKEEEWEATEDDHVALLAQESEKEKLVSDAFYKLEHEHTDATKGKAAIPQLAQLEEMKSAYKDDYELLKAAKKRLRDAKKADAREEEYRKTKGIGVKLVAENEQDKTLASIIDFSQNQISSTEQERIRKKMKLQGGDIFGTKHKDSKVEAMVKAKVLGMDLAGIFGEKKKPGASGSRSSAIGLKSSVPEPTLPKVSSTISISPSSEEHKKEKVGKKRKRDSTGSTNGENSSSSNGGGASALGGLSLLQGYSDSEPDGEEDFDSQLDLNVENDDA